MPVPLPLQPAGVNLPAQPQDPPTLADVVAAKYYERQVDTAISLRLQFLIYVLSLNDQHCKGMLIASESTKT